MALCLPFAITRVKIGDDLYPSHLTELPSPPSTLYLAGDTSLLNMPSVGVVGARRCTSYGTVATQRFVTGLAESNICIVSGGARGIDSTAHRSALEAKAKTVIVMGSGLNRVYPREHCLLFRQVLEGGGLIVTEFEHDERPKPENFPRRNRIVSGLSHAVLVVEAAKRSGSLITARIAVEDHGRDVFAVPGQFDAPMSQGTNWLIQQGYAQLTLHHEDVQESAMRFYSQLHQ